MCLPSRRWDFPVCSGKEKRTGDRLHRCGTGPRLLPLSGRVSVLDGLHAGEFPQSLKAVYPIVYNYSYLLAEGVITVVILKIPAVSKALERVSRSAVR